MLAFGIFFSFSCSNLENTQNSAAPGSDVKSLEKEIQDINREISENPGENSLQIEKANLLFRYAQTMKNPSGRKPVYSNIRNIADNLSAQSENELDTVEEVLVKAWRTEHSSGIKLLHKNQSDQSDGNIDEIVSHFENAITIMPDSLKTYSVLATTHYQHGNMSEAIETLKAAGTQRDQAKPEIVEKLAYLYLESGELPEAEMRYRQLVENYPEKLLYKHGLVNVLILSDRHEEAIELLEKLSEEYPTRYNYQESLATELYYLFKKRTEQYVQDGGNSLSKNDRDELAGLLNSAHSIFESIQESLPTTEENLYRIATFYKNTSLRLKELFPMNEEETFSDLQSQYMKYSLPLWERLAELNPENMGYLSNLHQVYLELGMTEDAESLERSYNF